MLLLVNVPKYSVVLFLLVPYVLLLINVQLVWLAILYLIKHVKRAVILYNMVNLDLVAHVQMNAKHVVLQLSLVVLHVMLVTH